MNTIKIIDAVFVKVTTPELWPACVGMTLPYLPLLDAMQYEIEECVRRSSFERRYGMSLEQAMNETSMTPACADEIAPASAGDAHHPQRVASETHRDEARG